MYLARNFGWKDYEEILEKDLFAFKYLLATRVWNLVISYL